MVIFIAIAGHLATAYLHLLLAWRFYPQRGKDFFVRLFWYLMLLSLTLHFVYATSYIALIFEQNEILRVLLISGYLLLFFLPAILAALFLGEMTRLPQHPNPVARVLRLISHDKQKLFKACISIAILSMISPIVTEFTTGYGKYSFGNIYALIHIFIFGGIWLLMFLSGIRREVTFHHAKNSNSGYVIAVVILTAFASISAIVDLNHAWSLVPIISTLCLSLAFCWYRFRPQFMDVVFNQFVQIISLISIVVGLGHLTFWMAAQQLNNDLQMLILFGFILISGWVFRELNNQLKAIWRPSTKSLEKIHSELPALLIQSLDQESSIKKTEDYLSEIFSTEIKINHALPNSVNKLHISGTPPIEIQLNYFKGWIPWFSEALNWVQFAGHYLQNHLKVLSAIEQENQQQLKAEALRSLAAKAELIAMRSQIRPHFLFNILNSIHSFISSDPKQAEYTIELLAELMRGILQISDKDEVPLARELDLVRKYLSIEKIRYGEQFQFEIEVAEDCLMQSVPAFSIQPLVENAIKYAVDSQLEPVTIKVNIRRDNQTLKIKVIDDGPGLIKGHSTGLGLALQNIANRLENLYGGAATLTLQNGDNKGVVVMLKIPMSPLKD